MFFSSGRGSEFFTEVVTQEDARNDQYNGRYQITTDTSSNIPAVEDMNEHSIGGGVNLLPARSEVPTHGPDRRDELSTHARVMQAPCLSRARDHLRLDRTPRVKPEATPAYRRATRLINIRWTNAAVTYTNTMAAPDYVSFRWELMKIANAGLAGETIIGILNSQIDVYGLEPSRGPMIAALREHARPADLIVASVHPNWGLPLTPHQATSAITEAATNAGISVNDIYLLP